MTAKGTKIADIKSPGKVAPSASGRPLLVTNRPVLDNDPMVTAPELAAESGPEQPVGRTAKTIKPISPDLEDQEQPDELAETASAPETEAPLAADKSGPAEPEATIEPDPAPAARAATNGAGTSRDSEAESHTDQVKAEAEAQAEMARQAELEELIASGHYQVPINAVHRQRSHAVTLLLCLIVVLLAIVALDVALDANLLDISGIPHTNLLRDR